LQRAEAGGKWVMIKGHPIFISDQKESGGKGGASQAQGESKTSADAAPSKGYGAGEGPGEVGIPESLLKQNPEFMRVAEALKGRLHVADDSDVSKRALGALEHLPDETLQRFGKMRTSVFVGNQKLSQLDDFGELATVKTHYASHPGATIDDFAAGIFSPDKLRIAVGALAGTIEARRTMLHEVGHAFDARFAWEFEKEPKQAFQRLHENLSPYEQQEGPTSRTGLKEMIAETFAHYFRFGKEAVAQRYDEEWAGNFEKLLQDQHLIAELRP
jgi:hypothetical protein